MGIGAYVFANAKEAQTYSTTSTAMINNMRATMLYEIVFFVLLLTDSSSDEINCIALTMTTRMVIPAATEYIMFLIPFTLFFSSQSPLHCRHIL